MTVNKLEQLDKEVKEKDLMINELTNKNEEEIIAHEK